MTTDNKTMADVQPGGRVRLGDVLPPLPKMQRFTNLYGETYAYSAEQMRDYAQAALAARQPVREIDEAAVLRRAAAVLYMWEDDPNLTGYMGDFKDACGILELLAQHAGPPAQAVDLGQSIPSELAPVAAALKRFGDCAEDSGSEGCDIGRDWFDALTTIGLLSRTQRSPAVWTMTEEGERLLALIDSKAVGNG
ncbi:hypothetical protein JY432_04855 [Stenotrophomonas maltophilia]|nr:hypothetical protein [Stenotrophomonas maltophilia]